MHKLIHWGAFIIFILAAVGLLAFFTVQKKQRIESLRNAFQFYQENAESGGGEGGNQIVSASSEDPQGEDNPLSLRNMMEEQYDGRDLTLGRVLEKNSSYTRYFITYKSGQLNISGIMNVPDGEGPFPVLVLNHGYIDPAEYTNGRGLKREQDYLARKGYVVVHPDYRNHAQSDKDPGNDVNMRLGYVEDVINAVYAIRASQLPYIDKENIGMLGHSMGGGITENIMVIKPDLVKAYGLFAPVSADNRDNYYRWTKNRPEVAAAIDALIGSPEDNPNFWEEVSPITYIERVARPVMLHHGTADESVPIEWSEKLVKAFGDRNKPITYYSYPGEGHEFSTAWPTVMQRTVEFMDQELKNG